MYVRERQLPGMSGTDADRMNRQKQYVYAFMDTLKAAAKEDPGILNKLLTAINSNVQTNLKPAELLFLMNSLRGKDFDLGVFESIPGDTVDLLYVTDEDELKKMILEIFFQN
jgi:anionic cell wall polymer biosynthesis LytR-Cps2A-Psr (LCP) family protein